MLVTAIVLSARYAMIADRALTESERDRKAAEVQQSIAEMRQKESDLLRQEAVAQHDVTQQALYKADIRLASIDHRLVNPLRLQKTLNTHIPLDNALDIRAWEWYYLLGASHQEASEILGHSTEVNAVDWSPDGKRIASTGGDGIRICNATNGELIYDNHDGVTSKCAGAWNPEGRRYAWGSLHTDNVIRIWDSLTNEVQLLQGHTFSLRDLCWSPDGRRLLSASFDKTCRVWDPETQKCLLVIEEVEHSFLKVCWNSKRDLAAAVKQFGVIVFNPLTGEVIKTIDSGNREGSVAFSADGTKLIVGDATGNCFVYDVENWTALLDFQAHNNEIFGIAVNPKYPSFATCGADGVVHVWSLADGAKHSTLFGHDGAVNDVDWDPTGHRLVSGSSDQRVLTWNVLESPTFHRFAFGKSKASTIIWDVDSSQLTCTVDDRQIATIDTAIGKVVMSALQHESSVGNSQLKSAAIETFINASAGDEVIKNKQFYSDANEEVVLWSGDESKLAVVTPWIPNSRNDPTTEIVVLGRGIEIWNIRKKVSAFSTYIYAINDAQWAADDCRLLVGGKGQDRDGGNLAHAGWVYIFDTQAGTEIHKLRHGSLREPVTAVGWNPSGTQIVSGNTTGLCCIWDATDGKLVRSLSVQQARIQSLAWSPDGKRIASADSRGQVRILDAETLEELMTLNEGAGGVKQLVWSPDGRQLAGVHSSGSVIIWNASRGYSYSNSDTFKNRIAAQSVEAQLAELMSNGMLDDAKVLLLELTAQASRVESQAAPDSEPVVTPTVAKLLNALGLAYSRRANAANVRGELDAAIRDYESAIDAAPNEAFYHNSLAWLLAACPNPAIRDPDRAVGLASRAAELQPNSAGFLNTLGVAQYRTGDLATAVTNLTKSWELDAASVAHNALFLSMAQSQLGNHEEARRCYNEATKWMTENKSTDEELLRFREEAEAVLEHDGP